MPTNFDRLREEQARIEAFVKRPILDVQNYALEVLPLYHRWGDYAAGLRQMLERWRWDFYIVANFNLTGLEPDGCRRRLNLLDQKLARCLLGNRWSRRPESERP